MSVPLSVQAQIVALRRHLNTAVVGQHRLLDRLVISLLTGGHVLVEGLPGLAKTTAVKALAEGVHARFRRIQFTPDLLPGDLTGSEVYLADRHEFVFREGPLFNEIVLADEINRAPAKVQSALLEAMQEHQITVAGVTRALPPLFMVMATQNPLEQAGTYPLPEAQLDRFLLHVVLDYPTPDEELRILQLDRARVRGEVPAADHSPVTVETVLAAREEVSAIHIAPELEQFIVQLVGATRSDRGGPEGEGHIAVGASPRASLAIARAATAQAYLEGRDYVAPDDILAVAPDCLRHRVLLSVQAHVAGVERDAVLQRLIEAVPVP
ncbi:AAA family ATPase [Ectothiorhodospiraceae bacterium 2226]|nr:AAA family ATPase [Ectothiorhodospiraceae bacterium 2226]